MPALDQLRPKLRRAARLRLEAANCLRIALNEREHQMAAQLIDEALKLEQRSQQLLRDDAT